MQGTTIVRGRSEFKDFDSMSYKEQWDYSRRRITIELALMTPCNIFLAVWASLQEPSFELLFFLLVGLTQNTRFCYYYYKYYKLYMSLLGDQFKGRSIETADKQIRNVRLYFFFIAQMLVMQTLVFLAGWIRKFVPDSVLAARTYDVIFTSMILISYNLFYIGISNSIYRTNTVQEPNQALRSCDILVITREVGDKQRTKWLNSRNELILS